MAKNKGYSFLGTDVNKIYKQAGVKPSKGKSKSEDKGSSTVHKGSSKSFGSKGGSKNTTTKTYSGGSQYSIKQDTKTQTIRKTQKQKNQKQYNQQQKQVQLYRDKATERNRGNRITQSGSQYSVANDHNRKTTNSYAKKYAEERKQREADNRKHREKAQKNYSNRGRYDARQSRIANTIDTNKPEDRATHRVKDLTEGTLKSVAGGHLTSLTHQNEWNSYDLERERIEKLHKNNKITDKQYKEQMKYLNERENWIIRDKNGKKVKVKNVGEEKASALQKKGDEQTQRGMKDLKGFNKIAAEAYTSGIGMATDYAFGGPTGSLLGMASRTYGNSLNETRELVKSGTITAAEAEKYSALQAAKEVGSELIFKGAGLAAGYAGAGKATEKLSLMTKRGIDKATQRISDQSLKNVLSAGLRLAQGATEEAAEELVGGILDPIVTNVSYANRLDKEYRESLGKNATSVSMQRDKLTKYGLSREQATQLFVDDIGSDDYIEDLAEQYMADGMSKKAAYKAAKNMQGYLIAELNGDKESLQKYEDKLADGIKAKFSLSDTLEAMASAGLMAGVSGGAGAVHTNAKGADIKAFYGMVNGKDHAAESITKLAMGVSDKEMASRAKAMNEPALKGHELSNTQYAELQGAIENQLNENTSKIKSAMNVAREQAKKDGYFELGAPQKKTIEKAENVRVRTESIINNFEKENDIEVEDGIQLAEQIAAFECGYPSVELVEYLTDVHPENRAVFEEVTGIELPADNGKMRDAVYKASISNYLDSAKAETIDRIDLETGNQDVQFANSYGGEGQRLYHSLTDNLGIADADKNIKYRTAFDGLYHAGLDGASFDAAMEYARDVHNLDATDAKEIYNAGIKDRNSNSSTVVYKVSDPTKIRNSEREVFLAFARAFNTNLVITDDITVSDGKNLDGQKSVESESAVQVNGMYDRGSNSIYINLNDDVSKPVGYTIMHELSHSLEKRFPEEYKAFANLYKNRWIEKNGQESFDSAIRNKIDSYKNSGVELSEFDALTEIIADQMGEILHDEEFVQNLAEENPSIARAILDSIRDIIRKIRQMFADFGGFRSEYNEATLSQLDLLKEAESLLLDAIKQAENARADAMLGIEDNTARFSLKNKNISINTRIPFIENNSYIKVKKSDYKSLEALRNKVRELHRGTYENRATGYKADITGETIGKILNPNGKNPKYNFVKYINNLNAATKLPELFENAVYIETKNNEKAKNTNKQIKSFHHFIAPIYMNGESYRVRIVAREKVNSDTLYIVDTEILPIKNGSSIGRQYKSSQFVSIPFDITIPSLVNGVKIYDYTNQKYDTYNADDVKFSLSSPVSDVIPSREEIINFSLDNPVNENSTSSEGIRFSLSVDSEGNKLTAEQEEYFKDSKIRDEEGNLLLVYHGTNAEFNTFKHTGSGNYFTANIDYAKSYGGNIRAFYLDIKKPFDVRDKSVREDYVRFVREGLSNFLHPDTKLSEIYKSIENGVDWNEADNLIEWFEENGLDYDGLVLYEGADLVDGKPVSRGLSYVTLNSNQSKLRDNGNPTSNPDIRFSMNAPYEETKDLIAVHNLKEDDIRGLQGLGGMPMPSIAIIKAAQGHNIYGEYSFVFDKATIDPKKNKANKVYGGDAWTPTFPRIDYEVVRNSAFDDFQKKISALRDGAPESVRRVLDRLAQLDELSDKLGGNNGVEGFKESLLDDTDMKNAFLSTKGEYVDEIIKTTKTTLPEQEIEQNEFLIDKLGRDVILELNKPKDYHDSIISYRKKYFEKYGDDIKSAYKDYLTSIGISEEVADSEIEGMKKFDFIKLIILANRYIQNGKTTVKEELDYLGRIGEINRRTDDAEYKKWLDDLFGGLSIESGLYNGKDPFTPSGNRRNFKQLHWDVTLENIVKAMKLKENGETLLGDNFKAVAQRGFSSIKDIKSDSSRLQNIDEAEYEKLNDELAKRESDIISSFFERADISSYDNEFIVRDRIRSSVTDSIRKSKNEADVLRKLKDYYYTKTATKEDASAIWKLAQDTANLPTGYFEAKPERAVTFDEAKAVIAPDNAPTDIIQYFDDAGIDVVQYENGNDTDRTEKLNSLESVKFSISAEPLPPLSEVIPSREEMIQFSLDNPVEGYDDIESTPNARGGKNKVISELTAEYEEIVRDNAKLTKGRILDRKSIKKQVSELIKTATADTTYNSRERREMTEFLLDTAEQVWKIVGKERPIKIKKSDPNSIENMNKMVTLIYNAADYVIGNAQFVNSDMLSEIVELRAYFKSHNVGVSDKARNELADDWNTIRRRNIGNVNFVNAEKPGATNIADLLYEEFYEFGSGSSQIIGMYGTEVQEAIEIGDEAELVRIIDRMFQDFSPIDDAFKSEYADDMRAAFTQDFTRIILDEGEAWKSRLDRFKDRYERRIKDMRERQKEAIRDIRAKHKQAIKDEKAKSKQKIAETKAKGEAKLQMEKDKNKAKEQKRKESEAHKKTWNALESHYKWLADKLVNAKTDDYKHIPSDFKSSVARFLEVFDLQTKGSHKLEQKRDKVAKKTAAMRELRDSISKFSKDTASDNEFLEYWIDECIEFVDGRSLWELEDWELDKVEKTLRAVKSLVQKENELFVEGNRQKISESGENIIEESHEKIKKYGRRYDYTRTKEKVTHLINESMMTPKDFFDSLGGTMREMYQNLRDGQDEYVRRISFCRDFFGELLGEYHNNKKPGSSIEEWQTMDGAEEITLSDGSAIKMTAAQMMSFYCLSKRKQAMQHICGSGIVISDVTMAKGMDKVLGSKIENTANGYRLNPNDVAEICSRLTEEQRRIADAIQDLMNTTLKEWGNETSLRIFDVELFEEENYFPITVAQDELSTEAGKATEIKGNRITSFGMTKPLNRYANNKLVIGDIFSVAADHCNKMSLYSAYAPALRDFNRVYNYKQRNEDGTTGYTVKGVLRDAYSGKAIKFIDNILDDINGQAQPRTDGVVTMINGVLARYKKAAIAFNPRVAIQQPTAIMRSLYILDVGDFTPDCFTNIKAMKKEMHEHCPIAAWKAWGNYQNDYTRSLEDVMLNKDWTKWEAVSMGVYGMLDDMTWTVMWNACKNRVKKDNPNVEVDSEEYWNLCNKLASEVFDETQVVDSVFHRSDAMRSKDSLTKVFTSFMAEPTRTYNMLRSSVVKAYRMKLDGDVEGARKELTKCVVVLTLNAMVVSAAAGIIDAFRGKGDDDDDWFESFLKNFGANFFDNENPLNNIVYVKDISNMIQTVVVNWFKAANGEKGDSLYTPSNMALEPWLRIMKGLNSVPELMSGNMNFFEWLSGDFGVGIGYLTGYPVATMVRDTKALWKQLNLPVFASDETDEAIKDVSTPSILDYERNPINLKDGSFGDKLLNAAGINLTRQEREERELNSKVKEIEKQTKKLSGKEKTEAINKMVTKGYTNLIEDGKMSSLDDMRKLLVAAGGDVEDFDEKVSKRIATEFKKTIGTEGSDLKQTNYKRYLLHNGWTETKISAEIIYKSNQAKEYKKACRELDVEAGIKALEPLMKAGIKENDIYRLYENRNMGSYDRYSTGKFISPTEGPITDSFGYRSAPTAGASTYHEGIDIGASRSSVVSAADGGKVVHAGWSGGFGNQVIIVHDDGSTTFYSHLDNISVKKNQRVAQKQYIGNVGSTGISTGPHLDFRIKNPAGQFVDPLKYIKA